MFTVVVVVVVNAALRYKNKQKRKQTFSKSTNQHLDFFLWLFLFVAKNWLFICVFLVTTKGRVRVGVWDRGRQKKGKKRYT